MNKIQRVKKPHLGSSGWRPEDKLQTLASEGIKIPPPFRDLCLQLGVERKAQRLNCSSLMSRSTPRNATERLQSTMQFRSGKGPRSQHHSLKTPHLTIHVHISLLYLLRSPAEKESAGLMWISMVTQLW